MAYDSFVAAQVASTLGQNFWSMDEKQREQWRETIITVQSMLMRPAPEEPLDG
jgi:hypothetical protein